MGLFLFCLHLFEDGEHLLNDGQYPDDNNQTLIQLQSPHLNYWQPINTKNRQGSSPPESSDIMKSWSILTCYKMVKYS